MASPKIEAEPRDDNQENEFPPTEKMRLRMIWPLSITVFQRPAKARAT